MGSVQFQIAPPSSLHFSISTGPFQCSQCYLQGFYFVAPVLSEAVPFVYLASVCPSLQCLISTLTQAGWGGGWSLIQVASSITLWGAAGAAFPATVFRLPAVLYGACPALRAVPALQCCTKERNKKLCLLFVSSPSERLRQPGASRAHSPRSPGAAPLLPSVEPVSVSSCTSRVPAPSPHCGPSPNSRLPQSGACSVSHRDPPGGCCPSRISGGL